MTRITLFLFFVISGFCVNLGQAQSNTFIAKGTVLRRDSLVALQSVTVYNTRSQRAAISNAQGKFSLYVRLGDTIRLSRIGFANKIVVLQDSMEALDLKIALKPLSYRLNEVQIVDFQYKILPPYKETKPNIGLSLPGIAGSNTPFTVAEPTMMNPISLMYSQFSKREKMLRSGREFIQRMEYLNLIDSVFNSPEIYEITGLKGAELYAFKQFCIQRGALFDIPDNYIAMASIKRHYETYRKIKQKRDW